MLKNNKGITLVALVITIIVLLILAGVSISLVIGDNGVLTQAKSASKETDTSSASQALQLSLTTITSDFLGNDWIKDFNSKLYDVKTQQDLDALLQKNGYYIVAYSPVTAVPNPSTPYISGAANFVAYDGDIDEDGEDKSGKLAVNGASETDDDYFMYRWITISAGTDLTQTDPRRGNSDKKTTYSALLKWSQKSVEIVSTHQIKADSPTVVISNS